MIGITITICISIIIKGSKWSYNNNEKSKIMLNNDNYNSTTYL